MQLSEMRDSARAKADEEGTGFISTDVLDRFINQGCRLIYGKLVQRFENYFIVSGTALNDGLITTVSGTQEYDLPSTLLKIVRVEYRQSTSTNDNDWRRLDTLNIANDQVDPRNAFWDIVSAQYGYFIAGSKLYIRPVPTDTLSIRLWFIPEFVAVTNSTDTPSIPEEYHELATEYAAIQCLRKSGEPIWKESLDMFNLELQNMLETAEIRDQQPEQMTITESWDTGCWIV